MSRPYCDLLHKWIYEIPCEIHRPRPLRMSVISNSCAEAARHDASGGTGARLDLSPANSLEICEMCAGSSNLILNLVLQRRASRSRNVLGNGVAALARAEAAPLENGS